MITKTRKEIITLVINHYKITTVLRTRSTKFSLKNIIDYYNIAYFNKNEKPITLEEIENLLLLC